MGHFPILMNLTDRPCLVVGGGTIAARKAQDLLACDAKIVVVAETLCTQMNDLPGVTIHPRRFEESDVRNMTLVIAATDDEAVNRAVYGAAHALGIPVNVVDVPDLCDFIVASTVRRGDFVVAISTCGAAPSLSRKIRVELEERFPEYYGDYVEHLMRLRDHVKASVPDEPTRRAIFERLTEPDILETLRTGGIRSAVEQMEKIVTEGINGSDRESI